MTLFNIPRLTKMSEEREYRLKGKEDRTMKIFDEFARLFNARGRPITSAAVLRQLVGIASHKQQFLDGSQQDILDFLFTLLGEIEKEISHSNWEAKVVFREFWGRDKIEKKFCNNREGSCGKCKLFPRVEEENFNSIQINIPDTAIVIPLSRLVDSYFQESSDIFKMSCSKCCCKYLVSFTIIRGSNKTTKCMIAI